MKSLKARIHPVPGAIRRFNWTFLLSGSLLAGTLGTAPLAFAATITDGTYISDQYYDPASGSYATPGGFNYTNGILSQTNTVSDPVSPFASATSTASLTSDQLSLSLSGSENLTSGTAEMWDTLTAGNLPFGPTVTANTVIFTLNMLVSASGGGGSSTTNFGGGLELFNTASFNPFYAGNDCGWGGSSNFYCSGLVGSNGLVSSSSSVPGTYKFSVPVTLGELTSGQIAYIAEIGAGNYTAPSLGAPLIIDPSIALTGLYSGVSVSSNSGTNYLAPVPLPGAAWLFGSGLVGLIGLARRQKTSD
ncbi:MAG: VPLPA-CTERM sorting domain-containing protein [Acidiferrobacterales bacterium]